MSDVEPQLVEACITLLDKTYQIKCPAEEQAALVEAAAFLDSELRRTRQAGIVGLDRIAIITALNLASDLLHTQKQKDRYVQDLSSRVHNLQYRIDEVLTSTEQLELE